MASEARPNKAIATGIAVWDVPQPAVAGERFAIKAGVKSEAGNKLAGCTIEVCDANGTVVARGKLGAAPLADTDALYWTTLEVTAPVQPGVTEFTARFVPDQSAPDHETTVSRFNIAVVRPPEHTLTVKTFDRETTAPLEGVEIRIGPYRARTDASGRANMRLCKGDYRLQVWKSWHDAPPTPLMVEADTVVDIAVVHIPEEHPDARWIM
jgi:hypothetical protein